VGSEIGTVLLAAVLHFAGPRPLPARATMAAERRVSANMSFLDNGVIKVGVDLDEGGAITYLSKSSDARNIVNDYAPGRQIGQSYYSGPTPYGGAPWPWNPVAAGDGYLDTSRVVASSNDGSTLYVRAVPLQWNVRAEPCECFFETWLSLDGIAVHARYRLTNHRSDLTHYGMYDQELPVADLAGRRALGRRLDAGPLSHRRLPHARDAGGGLLGDSRRELRRVAARCLPRDSRRSVPDLRDRSLVGADVHRCHHPAAA
jgi:hypothetical protein